MTKGTYRYAKKSVRPFDYTWEFNDLGKQVWQSHILHGVPRECVNNGLIILTMENTHPISSPPSTIQYRIRGSMAPCLLRPPRDPIWNLRVHSYY